MSEPQKRRRLTAGEKLRILEGAQQSDVHLARNLRYVGEHHRDQRS
jgi:hypothetical protein